MSKRVIISISIWMAVSIIAASIGIIGINSHSAIAGNVNRVVVATHHDHRLANALDRARDLTL